MRPIVAVSCRALKRITRKEQLGGAALGCRRRAFCLVSGIVNAQQHSPNVPGGSNCTIWGYREQRLRPIICDALCMASNVLSSKEESALDWYGDKQHFPDHTGSTWIAAKNFTSDGFSGNFSLVHGDTVIASQLWGKDTAAISANLRGTNGMTLATVNQPALPTFNLTSQPMRRCNRQRLAHLLELRQGASRKSRSPIQSRMPR